MKGNILIAFSLLLFTSNLFAKDDVKLISSVKELAKVASESNNTIKMKAGTYQIADYLTPSVIAATEPADVIGRKAMLLFSGSNNTFDLTGVTIEIATELLDDFEASINEVQINGSNNTIKGLTITDIGNCPPTTRGARSFVVTGDNNIIDGVTLNMSGSHPYGYGDLLGKGSSKVTTLNKHSGMLIEGADISILNCKIYSKSFGHLFFIQGGRNVYFENCYAEAVVRSTDEMLAETSGPAFDIDFKSVYPNQKGERVIASGYAKSLSECGFRNYGAGGPERHRTGSIKLVNCSAKNTRIGFAFTRMDEDIVIEDCEAQGCEVGYSLTGIKVKGSRGDAQNGPLFNISKSEVASEVELAVMPATSDFTIHALAAIVGDNHKIKLTKYRGLTREKDLPIMIGYGRPTANNGFSPMNNTEASNITINNRSGMPVVLNTTTSSCRVTSDAKVENRGESNKIK